MRLDFRKFIDKEFPDAYVPHSNSNERRISCISHDCPKPKNHMYVNVKKRRFLCHRCGLAGDDKAFLCLYYGLSYAEVAKNYGALYGVEEDYYSEVIGAANSLTDGEDEDIRAKINGFTIHLPRCYELINGIPKYLKSRNIPRKAIEKFYIGCCRHGFYKGRLIIPITTRYSLSFVAYSMFPKKVLKRYEELSKKYPNNKAYEKNKKKILNPKSSLSRLLLFNYDNIKKGCGRMFVVEGVFDAIRLWLLGEEAVAIFGINLSNFQRNLIAAKRPEEVIFMFDGDVWEDEGKLKLVDKAINKVARHLDSDVSYVRLDNGIDPDDISSVRALKRIVHGRNRVSGSHFAEVSAKLLNIAGI